MANNVVICSFGRSGSSYFVDLLKNLTSVFNVDLTELNSDNYLDIIESNYNKSSIYKFVFGKDDMDFELIKYFKNNNFKFIFLYRNPLDIFISESISKNTLSYSHTDTTNEYVDIEMSDLYDVLSYHNEYFKQIHNLNISYKYILYNDIIDNNNLTEYINNIFSSLFNYNKIYFDGVPKSNFIKQNTNYTKLNNVNKITNKFYIGDKKNIHFFCKNKRIENYYKKNVFLKIDETQSLNINIVNDSFFLMMDYEIDLFYDFTKNYICMCDNKIILVLTYNLNNHYEIINNADVFINYSTYELSSNLQPILNNYCNNITLLKTNNNPQITSIENSFIIHIDTNVERLQNIYNCNYTKNLFFVNAIKYDDDIVIKKFCNYIIYRNYFDEDLFQENFYNSFTKGSVCLALSNLLVLQYCLNNNIENFIIFEDDLVPNKNLKDINYVLDNKPKNSDIIFLNTKQDFRLPLKFYNDFYYYKTKNSWSTLSYCIFGIKTIKILIDYYSSFTTCIDCYIFKNLNCYCSKKHFFIDDCSYNSNIKSTQNEVIENNNIWNYDYNEYEFSYKKSNFVIFNYTYHETNNTWKSFINALYLNSNSLNKIDYNTVNIDKDSLIFFDFIDREFGWDYWKMEKKYPHGFPFKWGGIIHHPFKLNSYWGKNIQVSEYLTNTYVKKCLINCEFIIVLSDALKNEIIASKILDGFDIKIYVIYHILPLFTSPLYIDNPSEKKTNLMFLGWSFRNYELFYKIKTPDGFKKIILSGTVDEEQKERLNKIIKIQTKNNCEYNKIDFLYNLTNEEFVYFLYKSVVFIDFDGVSANNTIVECIKFNIPVICRKCKATIFYLDDKYPMFYENEEYIDFIIDNLNYFTVKSIEYLKKLNKQKFSLTINTINTLNIIDTHI